MYESEKFNQNKHLVEYDLLQHKNEIAKCFDLETFIECKCYIVDNFITRNTFPRESLLYKFATDKDITKLSSKNVIDSFTKLK